MSIYNMVNGQVRCTKSRGYCFTVGRCYEVKDGCVKDNSGYSFQPEGCRNAVEWLSHNGFGFELIKDYNLAVKQVIFNDPATIILWNNGTKTVAKCCDGDKYDAEKGFCIAYLKKMLGAKQFSEELHKWVKEEKPYKTKPPFNVGDKVKIVDHRNDYWNSEGEMDHWMGKIMTIRAKGLFGCYRLTEDRGEHCGNGWAWYEEDFARD